MPCKYGPVFVLYLYRIESNRVNTVQKRVRIYTPFSCVFQHTMALLDVVRVTLCLMMYVEDIDMPVLFVSVTSTTFQGL